MDWEIAKTVLIGLLLTGGLFFFLVGVIGLIRMPDVYCRIHTTTKCDTLGAGLIFAALIVWQGFSFVSLNLVVILLFVWFTNPTSAHYIAKAEYVNQQNKQRESQ